MYSTKSKQIQQYLLDIFMKYKMLFVITGQVYTGTDININVE